jgi:hypothetical protein
MGKRDHWTEERREAERTKNRERMARARELMTPEERSAEAARRKMREAGKAERDPSWAKAKRNRRSKVLRTYFQARKDDPAFWSKRNSYLARWRKERRIDEEFDAFMERIESGGVECD